MTLWVRSISLASRTPSLESELASRRMSEAESGSTTRTQEMLVLVLSWMLGEISFPNRSPSRVRSRIGAEVGSSFLSQAMLRSRKRSRDLAPCPGEALVSASTSESDAGSAVGGGVGRELEVGAGLGIGLRVGFACRCGALVLAADSDYSESEAESDAHMHVHVHVYTRAHAHLRTHTHAHAHSHTHTRAGAHAHTQHAHAHAQAHVHLHTHAHAHVHLHAHAHACTHTHAKIGVLTADEVNDSMHLEGLRSRQLKEKAKAFLVIVALVDYVKRQNGRCLGVSSRALLEQKGFLVCGEAMDAQARLRKLPKNGLKWVPRWQKRHGLTRGRFRRGCGLTHEQQKSKVGKGRWSTF